MQEDERTRKGMAILFSMEFWAGLAVLLALVSLTLPWWGITDYGSATSMYGVTYGSTNLPLVTFDPNLDTDFTQNYAFMTALVLITVLLAGAGAYLRRGKIVGAAFVFSILTMLIFMLEVEDAISWGCSQAYGSNASCVSSLIGQGTLGGVDFVTWGSQTGFYSFMATSLFLLIGVILRPTMNQLKN